ncbi:MAG: histidine phosphatase family protein [Lachnospiraceae bacterium]|nr:histidine phosphatase family protein [Lachnospiraceae bacterium]
MLKLTMIRHGKTYGNTLGRYIGITDESLLPEEAEDLKQYAFEEYDAVYASPLKRCVETAKILFPEQEIQLVDSLRECDFGEFENKNYQELSDNPKYQEWVDSGGTMAFPGGEDRGLFQERCIAGADAIIRKAIENEWEQVAMVVHGGTIMAILDRYGIPKANYFDWHVKNGEGYLLRINTDQYSFGKKELVVDGRFFRPQQEKKQTGFIFQPSEEESMEEQLPEEAEAVDQPLEEQLPEETAAEDQPMEEQLPEEAETAEQPAEAPQSQDE